MNNFIFENLYAIRDYFGGILEPNLWWIQIIGVIFSLLFLWGLIYIITKTNYLEMKKEQFLDILGKDHISRRRSLRAWRQIQKRLQSEEQNQWKLAILEADHILNEILKMSGYLGSRLDEKLELLSSAQIANIDDIKNAHAMRDKIANDPNFEISREEAEEIINIYKQAFKELNLIQE